jgi:hypothetical protein
MFTLILVGEFDIWRDPECKSLFHKYDYFRILLPTTVGALLSNISRYIGLSNNITTAFTILTVFILLIITNDIFGDASALKWIGKSFIFLMSACIIVGISEMLYLSIIVYSTGNTIQKINQNVILNFIVSLPSRAIQYMVIFYLVGHKRTLLKGGYILKQILLFPIPLFITSLVTLFNLAFYVVAYNLIIYDKVLLYLSSANKVIIVICVVLFPIINISGTFCIIYYIKMKEFSSKRIANAKLIDVLKSIQLYSYNGDFDNIQNKLKEFGMDIEEVASALYKEN